MSKNKGKEEISLKIFIVFILIIGFFFLGVKSSIGVLLIVWANNFGSKRQSLEQTIKDYNGAKQNEQS